MAETKTQKTTKKAETMPETVIEPAEKEFNLEQKVTIKSIAPWNTTFARSVDGIGDVNIAPYGSVRLSRSEVVAQVQINNTLFTGVDGFGSHATLYIDDKPTRIEVGFETKDTNQNVFSDEKIKELFNIDSMNIFEEKFKSEIRTRSEKIATIEALSRLGINDYKKIRFAENYIGYRQ